MKAPRLCAANPAATQALPLAVRSNTRHGKAAREHKRKGKAALHLCFLLVDKIRPRVDYTPAGLRLSSTFLVFSA